MIETGFFEEEQRFSDGWMGKIVVAAALLLMLVVFESMTRKMGASWATLFGMASLGLGIYLLVASRLSTRIDSDGIHYQFRPFHGHMRSLHWEEIRGCVVRRYSPLREYGGWGIRYGGSGLALNVGGKLGLQIVLENGKQILIGTQRRNAMEDALKTWRPKVD